MPELPEVETIKRDLVPLVVGKKITEAVVLPDPKGVRALRRYPSIPKFIKGVTLARVDEITRRGKYLLFHLNSQDTLIIHLGMTGQLLYHSCGTVMEPFTRIIFRLEGKHEIRFVDVRKFGELYLFSSVRGDEAVNVNRLGPEPLSEAFTEGYLSSITNSRNRNIKALLMDQMLIAGLGNIYSDEALFRAGIHPGRPASSLSRQKVKQLHRAVRDILSLAIECRGTSAVDKKFVDGFGQLGTFQEKLQVYQRKGNPCGICGTPIRTLKLAGRTSAFCPQCQR